MINIKRHSSVLIMLIMAANISGCLATSPVRYGELNNGVYQSSTNEFSLTLPAGAKMFDNSHPLGHYLVISNLHEPVIIQGISYYRAAQPKEGLSDKAVKNMIKNGHDFWAKGYEQKPMTVLHEEWIKIDGRPAYFTLLQATNQNTHYHALSLLRGNYSYVLFEKLNSNKEPLNANKYHLTLVQAFYRTVTFHTPYSIKFQAQQ